MISFEKVLTKNGVGVLPYGDVGPVGLRKVVRSWIDQVCQWHSCRQRSTISSGITSGSRIGMSLNHISFSVQAKHLLAVKLNMALKIMSLDKSLAERMFLVFACL